MYKIRDRGYDREFRFYCKAPPETAVGDRLDTDAGELLVFSVGRVYGDPPMRNAYLDVTPELVGAPTDALTPAQAAAREQAAARAQGRRSTADEAAAEAILAALERDGWSSARNTPCSEVARRRVYRELVEAGVLELDGYRYVPSGRARDVL